MVRLKILLLMQVIEMLLNKKLKKSEKNRDRCQPKQLKFSFPTRSKESSAFYERDNENILTTPKLH